MNEIYIRVLVAVVLASVGFGSGWKVATWRAEASSAADARQYAAGLAAAEDKRHSQEQAALSKQAGIEASYLSQLGKVKHEKDMAISNLVDGSRKLYVDTVTTTCNGSLPESSQPNSGSPTTTRSELPLATGAGIESIGSECDSLAITYKSAYERLKSVEGK